MKKLQEPDRQNPYLKAVEMIEYHESNTGERPTHIILGADVIEELTEPLSGVVEVDMGQPQYFFGCKVVESETCGIISPYSETR